MLDQEVLKLLFELRREEFVPAAYRSLAFVDMEIPLGHGEVMLVPSWKRAFLQELQVKKTDKILEVGSGSGYLAALLAKKGEYVHSVEIVPELKAMAEKNLQAHDIDNVLVENGDAARGWPSHAPYDVIVLTGSTPVLPEAFQKSLRPGGRLFAVVGDAPGDAGYARQLPVTGKRGDRGRIQRRRFVRDLYYSRFRNAEQPARFTF